MIMYKHLPTFIKRIITNFVHRKQLNRKAKTQSLPREYKLINAINYRLFNIFNQN